MPKYTISVLCHNQIHLTKRCLSSALKYSRDYELIITDNASTDGTKEYLRENFADKARVITKFTNTGFGEPHNRALIAANGTYFVVLNNDTEVCENWLDRMSAEFADPKVAIVGIKGACSSLSPDGTGGPGRTLDYIEASCLMIPSALARHHGLFDPAYKLIYFEDSDLSLRLREIGYKVAAVAIPVLHQKSASTCDEIRKEGKTDLDGYYLRNQHIFHNRWGNYLQRRNFTKRILVLRNHAIGDVILVTPILDALKIKYPDSAIDFVTQRSDPLRGNPSARAIGNSQTMPHESYDLVFDLNMAYEKQPFKHIVQVYAEACGVEKELSYTGYRPYLFPSKEDESWAQGIVQTSDTPIAVFHPGPTFWAGRDWSARNFAIVSRHFINKGWRVFLIGNKKTAAIEHTHDLRGQSSFLGMAALLKEATLFVGVDSAPMHAAVWADVPIAAIFGCIDPKLRLPPDSPPWFRGITAEGVGCLGCHHWQSAPRMQSGCLRDRVYCMEKLPPERVIAEAENAVRDKSNE